MKLDKQPDHFQRLSDFHARDSSPAKSAYYQCKADIAEKKLEIRDLEEEAKETMRDAGYEGYDS